MLPKRKLLATVVEKVFKINQRIREDETQIITEELYQTLYA